MLRKKIDPMAAEFVDIRHLSRVTLAFITRRVRLVAREQESTPKSQWREERWK